MIEIKLWIFKHQLRICLCRKFSGSNPKGINNSLQDCADTSHLFGGGGGGGAAGLWLVVCLFMPLFT